MAEKRIRYCCNVKDWFRNMDNIVINYRHMGEANHMYTIHMLGKCRIDRVGVDSKIWRYR